MPDSGLSLETADNQAMRQAALQAAAHWYAELCADGAGAADKERLQLWLESDELHQWAWDRVGRLQDKLGQLPVQLTMDTLESSERSLRQSRRTLLKSVALLGGSVPLLWAAYRQGMLADARSAVGEVKSLVLADGSQVYLNTATAMDIRFSATERALLLRRGEILVQTAHAAAESRPLRVYTARGRVRALGTRFAVRIMGNQDRIDVYQSRVQLTANSGRQGFCAAGSACYLDAEGISAPVSGLSSPAWIKQRLVVDSMPLDKFITELGRYRVGLLSCDPALAEYRISGVFNTADTDQALAALQKSFPLTISYRSPYWVRIQPRK